MSNLVFLGRERINRDPVASERMNEAYQRVSDLAEELCGDDYRAGYWLILRASVLFYLCGQPRKGLRDIRGLVQEWAVKTPEEGA